jgi:hypothetical protein
MTAVQATTDAFNGLHPVSAGVRYGIGGDASLVQGCHIKWDAAFIGVVTFWSGDFPEVGLQDGVPSGANGNWVQQNPPTGYTPVSPTGAATTATPLVITVPGGTAGGATPDIGNLSHRVLLVQVVCTQAGALRIRANGKF